MKQTSIWYQWSKALLVLLFAAMMAILFFSCQSKSGKVYEELPRLNTVNFHSAIKWEGTEDSDLLYNTLYVKTIKDQTIYFYTFPQTPYGVKQALTRLEMILSTNGADMMYPDKDISYKADDVEYITDYIDMNNSLLSGNSYVNFTYYLNDITVELTLNQQVYIVFLYE